MISEAEIMGGALKKAKITFTCPHEVKDKLESWAQSENRTLSNLIETLVAEALKQKEGNK